MTAKYLQENLDESETRALLFDVGMLYFLGIREVCVGVAVRSLGSDLRPSGTPPVPGPEYEPALEFQSSSPPTEGTFGVAGTWDLTDNVDLLTAVDFHHPSDARESLRTGIELGLRRLLYLARVTSRAATRAASAPGSGCNSSVSRCCGASTTAIRTWVFSEPFITSVWNSLRCGRRRPNDTGGSVDAPY